MNEPEYSVSYFISFFEAIPESRWTTHTYNDFDRYCALGHCGVSGSSTRLAIPSARALEDLIYEHYFKSVPDINDNETERFPQPTPRARILAALYEIKSKQTPPAPTLSTPALVVQAGWPTVTMGSVKVGEVRV